jgi:hypothetical protein
VNLCFVDSLTTSLYSMGCLTAWGQFDCQLQSAMETLGGLKMLVVVQAWKPH